MTQTQHSLIALELNRTLALSASWDEAAEALKRLDFDRYDRAMDAFWNNYTSSRKSGPPAITMTDPSPMTMLIEGSRDALECLRLLRLGILDGNVPMTTAIPMIDTTIDELHYAISAALDLKEAA